MKYAFYICALIFLITSPQAQAQMDIGEENSKPSRPSGFVTISSFALTDLDVGMSCAEVIKKVEGNDKVEHDFEFFFEFLPSIGDNSFMSIRSLKTTLGDSSCQLPEAIEYCNMAENFVVVAPVLFNEKQITLERKFGPCKESVSFENKLGLVDMIRIIQGDQSETCHMSTLLNYRKVEVFGCR